LIHFYKRTMMSLKMLWSTNRSSTRLAMDHVKRNLTAATENRLEDTYFRTEETNPAMHNTKHLGRIYTVDPEVPRLFGKELNPKENYHANNYFAPRQWTDRCKVLDETAIMVRKPAIQIINCIKNSDLNKPAIRYLLYGRAGSGKSITLAHLTHFGYQEGFITLTMSQIKKWLTRYYDVAPSTYTPGSIDHIANSNIFLRNFKQANIKLLSDPKLVTHRDYTWSVREKTLAGSPLLEVIEVGIERLPFAADALNVVIRELKLNCNEGNCKLMVVCDGVNSLFASTTLVHREKTEWKNGPYYPDGDWMRNVVKVDECSVLKNFKKLFSADYKNSVVVASVCPGARVMKTDPANTWFRAQEMDMVPDPASHLPFSLLGEEGWRKFDPFLPVEVVGYSEAELDAMISYYVERGWLGKEADSRAGRQEIHFLTGRHPWDFFRFSSSF